MNTETTFNVVEGQLVRYFCDRPENAWNGFELVDTGGNCEAYQYTFADGTYVWITDSDGLSVDGISDENFSVGLYDADGQEVCAILNGGTVDAALAHFGIKDQQE